jgi:hypothetical protein
VRKFVAKTRRKLKEWRRKRAGELEGDVGRWEKFKKDKEVEDE